MHSTELTINSEGIGVSVYDEGGNLVDETWHTHAEVEEHRENGGTTVTLGHV